MSEMKNRTIEVHNLLTEEEISYLRAYVKTHDHTPHTVHNLVMDWIDKNPRVLEQFRKHHILKAFGAYALEYMLELE